VAVTILVGNPRPASRTRHVAEQVGRRLARLTGAHDVVTYDLADYVRDLYTAPGNAITGVLADVAACDLLVVASPTYKATYTGLIKTFFDLYGDAALSGVVAVPVMTAGSPLHALAVETHLRPLLVELGASVPTKGVFVLMDQLAELDQIIDRWVADNPTGMRMFGAGPPRPDEIGKRRPEGENVT
jgi:FMN reductase